MSGIFTAIFADHFRDAAASENENNKYKYSCRIKSRLLTRTQTIELTFLYYCIYQRRKNGQGPDKSCQ